MKEKWELKGQMVRNRVDQYRKYRIPIYAIRIPVNTGIPVFLTCFFKPN